MDKIICIAGPTASGKTALAVELAKALNGEVVSCDSMYVYKYMNIGTAKPSEEEMQGIVHHMIDVCDPAEDFPSAVTPKWRPPLWMTFSPGARPPLLPAAPAYTWTA